MVDVAEIVEGCCHEEGRGLARGEMKREGKSFPFPPLFLVSRQK
jgi:hypothetical protein